MNKKTIKTTVMCFIILFSFFTVFSNTQADYSSPHSVKGTLYINDEIPTSPPFDFEEIIVKLIFPGNNIYCEEIYEYNIYCDSTNYNVGFWGHEGETADIIIEYYGQDITPEYNQTIYIDTTIGYILDLHITAEEPDIEPPSKVTGLEASDAKDEKLDLTWDTATDNIAVDHYKIYRDNVFIDTEYSTTYQDTGLTNGQEYCYKISAVDTSSNEGEKSNQKCATPTATIIPNHPPNKPINPTPENNSADIGLGSQLSVYVTDPDNDMLTVSFYNASNDQLIGSVDIQSGNDAMVQWNNLGFNNIYYWYAVANDSQYETKSDVFNFKTIEEDNNPPNVFFEKPEEGSLYVFGNKIFSGILTIPFILGETNIVVNATDNESDISKVELSIKGKWFGKTDELTENPYTYEWTGFAFGNYNVTATAYDVAGNSANTSIIVRKYL